MLRADLIDFTLHKPFLKTTSPVNLLKVFNTRVFSLALIRTLLTRGLILLYATFIIVFLVIGKYSLIPFQLAVMKSLLNYVLLEIGRNSPFLKPKDIIAKIIAERVCVFINIQSILWPMLCSTFVLT